MTALCGGGASQQKPGTPAAAYVGGSELAALIGGIFNVPAWIAIAAYAAAQDIGLAALCATDPPAMPTFTASDITALLNPNPFATRPSDAKLNALLQIAAWYTFCQCSTVATPTPPAAPTYPSTAPQLNPTGIAPLNQSPCWNYSAGNNNWSASTHTMQVLPQKTAGACSDGPGVTVTPTCLNVSSAQFTVKVDNDGSTSAAMTLNVRWQDASNFPIRIDTLSNVPAGTTQITGFLIPPANWNNLIVQLVATVTGQNNTGTVTAALWCPGTLATNPQSPCCPPDPSLNATLQQILGALQNLYSALPVTLTSYAESTVHSGLSGNGTISIGPSCIAVKVAITGDTTGLPISAGSPSYYYNRGYIVPITLEAPIRGPVRLVYNPQQYVLPTLTEQIGYTLTPGVTISITELVRGP